MLVEASIRDLVTSTNQIETKFRQHISNQVQLVGGYEAFKVGADLVFQADVNTGHHPKLRITGVQETDDNNATSVVLVGGERMDIKPLQKSDRAFVTCDCDDFVFRFALTNQSQGVLFGKITKQYIPKTNRPSQNLGVIGVCKHILKLVDVLTADGVVA
jgi:hypothetical protein